jgi:hypothetical protein
MVTAKLAKTTAAAHTEHASLNEALVAAQAEFAAIPKEATGQARGGKYQYATLSAVIEAVVPALNRHGVILFQRTVLNGELLALETTFRHVSGEELTGSVPVPIPANWQEWGSAMTYARRYSLLAMAGVAPETDDDAATAQGMTTIKRTVGSPNEGWRRDRPAPVAPLSTYAQAVAALKKRFPEPAAQKEWLEARFPDLKGKPSRDYSDADWTAVLAALRQAEGPAKGQAEASAGKEPDVAELDWDTAAALRKDAISKLP